MHYELAKASVPFTPLLVHDSLQVTAGAQTMPATRLAVFVVDTDDSPLTTSTPSSELLKKTMSKRLDYNQIAPAGVKALRGSFLWQPPEAKEKAPVSLNLSLHS